MKGTNVESRREGTGKRIVRWMLGCLVVAVALGALSVGALELWLRTESGRERLGDRLEQLISREIRGSLRIGAIDRYSFGSVEAREVQFLDPRDEAVIHLPHVELGIDLVALASRKLVLKDA